MSTIGLDRLLIHPRTQAEIDSYLTSPTQTLLVVGPDGSGKTALILSLASQILATGTPHNHPYFHYLQKPNDKKEIPIEDVRNLVHKLRLKTTGRGDTRRVVFIEDAHYLSGEAQNALLKVLEEPNDDTVFIMSINSLQGVLPTIISRSQVLNVFPVGQIEARNFFSDNSSEVEINSAWQLSRGNAGLLSALLFDEDHQLKSAVNQAKDWIKKSTYERLIITDKISKNKDDFAQFLAALSRVINALHRAAVNAGSGREKDLISGRKLVFELQKALAANTSPRLVAMELVLNLRV